MALTLAFHLHLLPGGFLGVDLFFVLSGYLITGLLLERTPQNRRELGAWWMKRVRRLTPIVAIVVAATVIAFAGTRGVAADGLATLSWWQNWHLILVGSSYWSPSPSPLRHAWSLSIEEQFYLVWPLVVVGASRLSRVLSVAANRIVLAVSVVGASASFGWAWHLSAETDDLSRIYFGTDTRMGALLLGCAAAAAPPRAIARVTGRFGPVLGVFASACLAALVVTLTVEDAGTYRGGLLAAACVAVLLVVAAAQSGWFSRVLGLVPLRWIGVRSYALYLISFPIQRLVETRWTSSTTAGVAVVTIALSVPLATLSLRWVETPLRHRTSWASTRPVRAAAWGGGALLVSAALIVTAVNEPERPVFESVSAAESLSNALEPPTTVAATSTTTTSTPERGASAATVTTTPPPPPARVMVSGDSVAFTAAFEYRQSDLPPSIASLDGRGVIGCGVLSRRRWHPVDTSGRGEPAPAICADQAKGEQLGLSVRPEWDVLFAGAWEHVGYAEPDGTIHEAMSDGLRMALLDNLTERARTDRAAGTRTAFVAWACPGRKSGVRWPDGYATWMNAILREAAARVEGAIVIEPTQRVCVDGDPDGDPTVEKDEAYHQAHHPEDQAWLWKIWLGPALEAAPAP